MEQTPQIWQKRHLNWHHDRLISNVCTFHLNFVPLNLMYLVCCEMLCIYRNIFHLNGVYFGISIFLALSLYIILTGPECWGHFNHFNCLSTQKLYRLAHIWIAIANVPFLRNSHWFKFVNHCGEFSFETEFIKHDTKTERYGHGYSSKHQMSYGIYENVRVVYMCVCWTIRNIYIIFIIYVMWWTIIYYNVHTQLCG